MSHWVNSSQWEQNLICRVEQTPFRVTLFWETHFANILILHIFDNFPDMVVEDYENEILW